LGELLTELPLALESGCLRRVAAGTLPTVLFFDPESRPEGWRAKVYEVIFETDTPIGKLFDICLLVAIVLSVVLISLETVPEFEHSQHEALRAAEWVLTGLFTIEYILRLVCVREAKRYALSVMGIVDLLSLLPTLLSPFVDDAQVLQLIRSLRLLRVFRVFQVGEMAEEGSSMVRALIGSRYKIAVFLGAVLIVVVIQGALLYYVEHDKNQGFDSIPSSVYWAVVTLTTVGYGDISPVTPVGQFIASVLMLLGYGIIAIPTGIVSAEVVMEGISERINAEVAVKLEAAVHHELGDAPGLAPGLCLSAPPKRWVVVVGATGAGVSVEAEP